VNATSGGEPPRDLLIHAARVHAFAPGFDDTRADAVLLCDGRVAAVGRRAALTAPPGATVIELPGATLTPGLTDAHIHLLEWAVSRREVRLEDATDPADAARRVADHARSNPGYAGWIRGGGWNPHRWPAAPARESLDAALPDRPVVLQSHDMHSLWLNSAALAQVGIDEHTPDPVGGRIVRDAAGRPTGVLLDAAAALVLEHLPAPSAAEAEAALLDAQAGLHRLGITGVHSFPNVHLREPQPLAVLERLRARDALRLRVLQHLPLDALDGAIRLGLRSGFGGPWLRIGALKLFVDGALGSRTAWLRAPYEGSDDRGIRVTDRDTLAGAITRAAAAGIASAVHAIGDAAVDLALELLAAPPDAALPHRIEHLQLCAPDRFAEPGRLGIIASVQPAHLITDWRPAERHWGCDRSRGAFAFASLLAAGATLAFGSDAPVEPVDPRLALCAATARVDLDGEPAGGWFPGERISARAALEAFTRGPARAAGRTGREGTLAPGAVGDLVAWDRDPLTLSGREFLDLHCVLTVSGGAVVWRA